MALLLGALILGFLLARSNRLPRGSKQVMNKLGNVALFALLFSMGSSLGSNSDLVRSLPTLGLKALVMSLSAVIGSVFLVWLLAKVGGARK